MNSSMREMMRQVACLSALGCTFDVDQGLGVPDHVGARFDAMSGSMQLQMVRWFEWAHYGFQVIEPTSKIAASFAATTGLAGLELPWPTFTIDVPVGLIVIDHRAVGESPVEAIMVRRCVVQGSAAIRIELILHSAAGAVLHRVYDHLDELDEFSRRELSASDLVWAGDDPYAEGFTPRDQRAFTLAGRLVLGCVAELDSWGRRRRLITAADRLSTKPSSPKLSPWVLTRPVVLDVRESVASYCRGGGSSPTVRTLVRGHWKRQPHGAAGLDRKLIHVEPYWRGPDDAGIAIRSHKVGDK